MKFKKSIKILFVLVIGILIVIALVFLSKEVGDYKKVANFIKSEVGNDYYKNFKFTSFSKETRLDSPLGPSDRHIKYYKYEFLPFSEKYKYYIIIEFDTISGSISNPNNYYFPLCVYKAGADRCNFNISYSQAYDIAVNKFKDNNFTVSLVEENQKIEWKVLKIIGDPYCEPLYKYFYINADDGSETSIEENQTSWCT